MPPELYSPGGAGIVAFYSPLLPPFGTKIKTRTATIARGIRPQRATVPVSHPVVFAPKKLDRAPGITAERK